MGLRKYVLLVLVATTTASLGSEINPVRPRDAVQSIIDEANQAGCYTPKNASDLEICSAILIRLKRATAIDYFDASLFDSANVLDTEPPDNYLEIIDREFSNRLFDSESKRVDFFDKMPGGIICGTVNAKNLYGAYVGKRFFYAAFGFGKTLLSFKLLGENDLDLFLKSQKPGEVGYIPLFFLRRCGVKI